MRNKQTSQGREIGTFEDSRMELTEYLDVPGTHHCRTMLHFQLRDFQFVYYESKINSFLSRGLCIGEVRTSIFYGTLLFLTSPGTLECIIHAICRPSVVD